MNVILSFCCVLLCVATAYAQEFDLALEQEAVTRAALDYIEGAHEGNVSRIERAVHPELTKVTLATLPQTGKTVLRKAGSSRLRELVRANVAFLEKDKRKIQISVFAVKEGLAAVRTVSAMFYDYLQLAKIDGKWQLINVLWINNPGAMEKIDQEKVAAEKEAITGVALDYIEGSFTGEVSRMKNALHPELTKVIPVALPQTGQIILDKMGSGMLIEGTRAQMGLVEEGKRDIQVNVLDLKDKIACVEVLSAMYYDYLQMAKIDGSWKIVNVLWKMNPNAPNA